MQVICPISGRAWQRDSLFGGIDLTGVHPIFTMKKRDLLSDTMIHRFSQSMNHVERKLYFLAIMNTSDLVYFNAPAMPSVLTVEANFLSLFDVVQWLDYAPFLAGSDIATFPHYVVSQANSAIDNIEYWIAELHACRQKLLQKDVNRELSQKRIVDQQRINKEIANAFLKDQAVTRFIVNWAFEFELPDQAAGITQKRLEDHPRADLYKDILTSKLKMAFTLDRDILNEIHNFLFDNLPKHHPIRVPLMGQLELLQQAQRKGWSDWEIVDDTVATRIDTISADEILTPAETTQRQAFLAQSKVDKPLQSAYKTKFEYLQAVAKWVLAKDQIAKAGQVVPGPGSNPDVERSEVPSIEDQVKEHFDEQNIDSNDSVLDSGDDTESTDESSTED